MTTYLGGVTALSLNCRWSGFGTTQREALPWTKRCDALQRSISKIKPDVILAQELGDRAHGRQADDLFGNIGYHWDSAILNGVAWNPDRFDLDSTKGWPLKDGGQFPGRSLISAKLRDRKTKARFRIASTHLATKSNSPRVNAVQAATLRASQMHKVVSTLNDDENDWPMVLGMDSNSKASDVANFAPRYWAKKYGWDWDGSLTGIDLILTNFGAVADKVTRVELGTASDHDGVLATIHTTKR